MADRDVQVPLDDNLHTAQAAAVVQAPQPQQPSQPPPQNPEEQNPQNAAGYQVTLEVCLMFVLLLSHTCFLHFAPTCRFTFFFRFS